MNENQRQLAKALLEKRVPFEPKQALDLLNDTGYLEQFHAQAVQQTAVFWWSATAEDGAPTLLHNGTVCFLDTGKAKLGITADHVYAQYLRDKATMTDVECQIGCATIRPELYLRDRDAGLDLATFVIPPVILREVGTYKPANYYTVKRYHTPSSWPPDPLSADELVTYGGYPGLFANRKLGRQIIDFPFQHFGHGINDITSDRIALHVNFDDMHWPGHDPKEINTILGGQSGGPVYRMVPARPVFGVELVGFISEYNPAFGLMIAKPARHIASNGALLP